MIQMKNITLLEVNCVDPELGVKSLLYSSKDIEFGSIKIFSHYKPDNLVDKIEFIQIPKLTHDGFSQFCIEELTKYVNTDYALSINDDGFIINPHLWRDKFLEYDYIGAPWAPGSPWCSRNRVGNGGFVLKSKKFMDLSANIIYSGGHDDVIVTNTYYDYFTSNGCKYAPIELAMKFALESEIPECEYDLNNCFGFHGKGQAAIFGGKGQQFADRIKLLETI